MLKFKLVSLFLFLLTLSSFAQISINGAAENTYHITNDFTAFRDTIDARAQSAINDSLTALRATGLTDYDSVRAIVSDSLANATNYDSVRAIANDSLSAYFPVTNANLNGSITDSKLNQITTANKVAGSAVQLNSGGSISNSNGLKISDGGIEWDMFTTAVKDSVWKYSAGTINITNNVDDTTLIETGGTIKIKSLPNEMVGLRNVADGSTLQDYIKSAGTVTYQGIDSLYGATGGGAENFLINSSHIQYAVRLVPASSYQIAKVGVFLWRIGTPSKTLVCQLYSNDAGEPNAVIATSIDTLFTSSISTSSGSPLYGKFYYFQFPVTANTAVYDTVWISLKSIDGYGDGSNYIKWGFIADANGSNKRLTSGTWYNLTTGKSFVSKLMSVSYDTTSKGVTVTSAMIVDSSIVTSDMTSNTLEYIRARGNYLDSLRLFYSGSTGGSSEGFAINSSFLEYGVIYARGSLDKIGKVAANIYKIGSPAMNIWAEIWSNSAGLPGTKLGASTDTINASTLTSTVDGQYYDFTFDRTETSGQDSIWLILRADAAGDVSNYVKWGRYTESGIRTVRTASSWTVRYTDTAILSKIYESVPDTATLQSAINDSLNTIRNTWHKSNWGSNIQNSLSKLRSLYSRFGAVDTFRVAMLGDSRQASKPWVDSLETWLGNAYPNIYIEFNNWSYGGYNTSQNHIKYFEDTVIHPNIDLLIWSEYEEMSQVNSTMIQYIFETVRRKSTADIIMSTYNPGSSFTGGMGGYGLDVERDIARRYNAELIDVWAKFNELIEKGNNITDYLTDGTHENDLGGMVYYNLFKSHLDTSAYRQMSNYPNYANDAIYVIEFEEPSLFYDSTRVQVYGSWSLISATDSLSGYGLQSSLVGDSIIVQFDGVGFDFFYNAHNTSGVITVTVDGETPSEIRVNGKPLEYATIGVWDASNSNNDSNHRMLKAIVNDTTDIGTFTIEVIDAAQDSFKLLSPSSADWGHGVWTASFTSDNGDITIPSTYGGSTNSQWLGNADYANGDKFYFTVKRNWVNTVDAVGVVYKRKVARIFGLTNTRHTVKLVHSGNGTIDVDALRVFRPVYGRH